MNPKEEFKKHLLRHAQTCENFYKRFPDTETGQEMKESAERYRKQARKL